MDLVLKHASERHESPEKTETYTVQKVDLQLFPQPVELAGFLKPVYAM